MVKEKLKTKKDKKWLEEEDWKINVWNKDGKLIIKDGIPIKS